MTRSWLRPFRGHPSPRLHPACRRPRFFLPRLDALEIRCVPTRVTNLNDAGPGSLRQAILDAPAGGTVAFQPGLTGTITLTTGELAIARDLFVSGPGAAVVTVSGNNASRVFNIAAGTTVTIAGLTISNGRVTSEDGGGIANFGTLTVTASILSGNSAPAGDGGGISNDRGTLTVTASTLSGNSAWFDGGGIYNISGSLTVTASTLSGNSSGGRFGGGGGGIRSLFGTLTVTASTFSGNISPTGGGGGIAVVGTATVTASTFIDNSTGGQVGGGLSASGTVTVAASTFIGNSAGFGGGISASGTMTVTASTLSGNSAPVDGGGIYNYFGSLTVTASTLSDNSAGNGGGIFNDSGRVTVTASTLSGNSAHSRGSFGGGGIANRGFASPLLTVTASTLSGNFAAESGGGIASNGRVTARNTLVAGNAAGSAPDVRGRLSSQGHNLIGDGTGGSGYHPTDLVGTPENPIDPRLAPLGDYGGPTLTHALLADSPALDAGDNTDAPAWDQRGWNFVRVIGGRIDIGAFERPVGPQLIRQSIIRTLGPVGSLRVTFDRAMDVASFTPDKIWFFSGPLGDIPVTAVTVVPDSGDRLFDIIFPEQTVTSLYTMHIGPYILDADGVPMDHDVAGPPGEFGDMYIAQFGIEGPRVLHSSPSGTVGGPVGRVRLTFSVPMDPAAFDPSDVYYWVGPEGPVAVDRVEPVPGSGNTQFDVVPQSPLSAAGEYWLAIWPDVRDYWGNPMDQDNDLLAGEGIEDGYLATFESTGTSPSGPSTGARADGRGADSLAAALSGLIPPIARYPALPFGSVVPEPALPAEAAETSHAPSGPREAEPALRETRRGLGNAVAEDWPDEFAPGAAVDKVFAFWPATVWASDSSGPLG